MAKKEAHLRQAQHNENLLASLDHGRYPDWYGIVTFYAALHYVEALFVHYGESCTKHARREFLLKENYPDIFKHYRPLCDFAMNARYGCGSMAVADLKSKADPKLKAIKDLIRKDHIKDLP